jgi:hypothetical protein
LMPEPTGFVAFRGEGNRFVVFVSVQIPWSCLELGHDHFFNIFPVLYTLLLSFDVI